MELPQHLIIIIEADKQNFDIWFLIENELQNYKRKSFNSDTISFMIILLKFKAAPVNSLQQFRILTNDVKTADFSVTITTPTGNRLKAHIVNTEEGILVNFSPNQVGEYLLFIAYMGTPLLTEPYRIQCLRESDPNRVFAFGPGLHSGIVNQPAEFMGKIILKNLILMYLNMKITSNSISSLLSSPSIIISGYKSSWSWTTWCYGRGSCRMSIELS